MFEIHKIHNNLLQIIQVYESRENVDRVIECIPNIFYNVAMSVKFANALVNQHKVRILREY